MRRRCQRNSVSGVTSHPARLGRGSAAAIAASKLRSASVISGRSTCRRSTPSWWRNTMISRSFERPDRTVSRASDARNRYKIRYTTNQHRPHRGRSTTTAEFPAGEWREGTSPSRSLRTVRTRKASAAHKGTLASSAGFSQPHTTQRGKNARRRKRNSTTMLSATPIRTKRPRKKSADPQKIPGTKHGQVAASRLAKSAAISSTS